jgi:hypothetical protein
MKTPNALNSASVPTARESECWDGKMVSWLRQSVPRPRGGVVNSWYSGPDYFDLDKLPAPAKDLRRGRGRGRLGAVLAALCESNHALFTVKTRIRNGVLMKVVRVA